MLSSPSPEAVTPQRGVSDASGPVSVPSERPSGSKDLGEIRNETYNPASSGNMGSSFSSAAGTIASAMPSSSDVEAQLAEAKAQIARLTQQVSEATGLRQRKTVSAQDSKQGVSTSMDTRQAPAGGVSVQITALLCLISFLIAYFLF